MSMRRVFVVLCSMWLLAAPLLAFQPPTPQQQNEFVPVNELPPGEQLSAAPLLIAAYAFVWVALFVYLWSIRRRLGKVEADMRALEQRRGTR